MATRRFAVRCSKCHQKTMAISVIPHSIRIDHDGKKYDVHIPDLSVPQCTDPNCREISIDEVASDQIDKVFRRTAGLLTASEIKEGRIRLGYRQQQEFARCLGISVSTLSRWETGAQVQQRSLDKFMRAVFDLPTLQDYLVGL